MRLGIFGGTFNPPHMGHLGLVTAIADKMKLDRVLIIPASVPPHKHISNLAGSRDRLEMCRLAFGGDGRFFVSDTELKRSGKSYTYDTLCELREEYPDAELFLIVGSDMLATFDEWYRYHDILMMSTLCAASRKHGYVPQLEGRFTDEEIAKIEFIEISVLEVSSTLIRRKLSERENTHGLLSDSVREYIDKKGLYT
ncbi:MAG: nicotinate-nucleotide adenylyltransferase [Acutalibacteraceae bacterium]